MYFSSGIFYSLTKYALMHKKMHEFNNSCNCKCILHPSFTPSLRKYRINPTFVLMPNKLS